MARDYHTDPEKKPYRFVPLADHIERSEVVGHHKMAEGRWYGYLNLILVAESSVHVASGLIVHRDDLRPYIGVDIDPHGDDRLILSHVRRDGRRYIPGTSLKGVVRSVVEAVTHSCLQQIDEKKIDRSARRQDRRLSVLLEGCSDETGLCPACGLFGTLGYTGRVNFRDFLQVSGDGRIVHRPIAHPPQPDRSQSNKRQTQGIIYYTSDEKRRLKGRKFYLHGKQPVDATGKYEAVEVCKRGSCFEGRMDVNGLTDAELGLLLWGLGFPDRFRLKVGGSKPFGYGSVALKTVQVCLVENPLAAYLDYDDVPARLEETVQLDILARSLKAVESSMILREDAWKRLLALMKMDLVSLDGRY